MPFAWVPSARLMHHKGVNIYAVYKGDWADSSMLYWYSTSPLASSDEDYNEGVFDVRDLPQHDMIEHSDIIKRAIDDGLLARHEDDDGPENAMDASLPEDAERYIATRATTPMPDRPSVLLATMPALIEKPILFVTQEKAEDYLKLVKDEKSRWVVAKVTVSPIKWAD